MYIYIYIIYKCGPGTAETYTVLSRSAFLKTVKSEFIFDQDLAPFKFRFGVLSTYSRMNAQFKAAATKRLAGKSRCEQGQFICGCGVRLLRWKGLSEHCDIYGNET